MSGRNTPETSQVRIIGGQWRGRKIYFEDSTHIRPTPDRVRETLFNWLQWDIEGTHCLDLFAGTGVLGFEALSRGAAQLTLVEKNAKVVQTLKENLQRFQVSAANLVQADAIQWLINNSAIPQDIIFCDPPFNQGLIEASTRAIEDKGWLKPGGLIYCEAEKDLKDWLTPSSWECLKHKKAGKVQYALFQKA